MRLKALRGAVNFEADEPNKIEERTVELFDELIGRNELKSDDIVCVFFSLTDDIKSEYPAKVFRERFFSSVPLFSCLEPNICGGMSLTLRTLVLHYGDKNEPVYLYETKKLRKDIFNMNIAIDGPSGAGKSTIAKLLAKKLNMTYLDTGAMYRAIGLKAYENGVDISDEAKVREMLVSTSIEIETGENGSIFLDGRDVGADIRQNFVSKLASDVSALGCVRTYAVDLQRKIASKRSSVLDGRDIGTVVLPDAEFKFFLTASIEERAHRRYLELVAKGQQVSEEQLIKEMLQRDHNDANRAISPLKKAEDAIEIDSTHLTIEQVCDKMLKIISEGK